MPSRALTVGSVGGERDEFLVARVGGERKRRRKRDEEKAKRTFVRRALFLREREKDGASCRAPSCVGRVSAKRAHAAA